MKGAEIDPRKVFAARSRSFSPNEGDSAGSSKAQGALALGWHVPNFGQAPTGRDSLVRPTICTYRILAPLGLSVSMMPVPRAGALGYRISPHWGCLAESRYKNGTRFDKPGRRARHRRFISPHATEAMPDPTRRRLRLSLWFRRARDTPVLSTLADFPVSASLIGSRQKEPFEGRTVLQAASPASVTSVSMKLRRSRPDSPLTSTKLASVTCFPIRVSSRVFQSS